MRISFFTVCLPVFFAVSGSAAAAQDVLRATPGERVRVWAPQLRDQRQLGTLLEIRGDTLVVQAARESDTLRIPGASVTRLDVSSGRRSHVGSGIMYGALGGLVTGALAGAIVCQSQSSTCVNTSDGDMTLLFALGGAVLGAGSGVIVGGIIGAASSGEQWKQLPPSSWRVGFAPLRDGGFAFAASVRF